MDKTGLYLVIGGLLLAISLVIWPEVVAYVIMVACLLLIALGFAMKLIFDPEDKDSTYHM